MNTKRGQLNFINIFFLMISFFVLLAIMPAVQAAIDNMFPNANTFTGYVINLTIPFTFLGLIALFFMYSFPRRPE